MLRLTSFLKCAILNYVVKNEEDDMKILKEERAKK